jgi:hypothetical protein
MIADPKSSPKDTSGRLSKATATNRLSFVDPFPPSPDLVRVVAAESAAVVNSNPWDRDNASIHHHSGLPRLLNSPIGPSLHSSGKEGLLASSAKRLYRASGGGDNKYVTRDIAALDFLLGIPLAAEANLVQSGWRLQQKQHEEDDVDQDSSFSSTHPDIMQDSLTAAAATSHGTWWEKYIRSFAQHSVDSSAPAFAAKSKQNEGELERPDAMPPDATPIPPKNPTNTATTISSSSSTHAAATRTPSGVLLTAYTPGRRLDGDAAIRIQIPLTTDDTKTKQKSIARLAAIREWERQTAHGLHASSHPPLLDGRLFFSASGSYPISVFSVVRYEPRREQAEFRRKKLESLGGGGSQFVMPTRDWRGISYRVLLPRRHEKSHHRDTTFNRFVRNNSTSAHEQDQQQRQVHTTTDNSEKLAMPSSANKSSEKKSNSDNESVSSDSSEDSTHYAPGMLDDPDMVLGRHRNVMMGDHITGPIVSSTIQFVKPAILKAELNTQFRERFDGWEPPKPSRKYIGAFVSVQEGKYVLRDPADADLYDDFTSRGSSARTRQGSTTSMSSGGEGPKEKPILRIPPSLTLSKIRSLKQQALAAAIKAQLEVGTVGAYTVRGGRSLARTS